MTDIEELRHLSSKTDEEHIARFDKVYEILLEIFKRYALRHKSNTYTIYDNSFFAIRGLDEYISLIDSNIKTMKDLVSTKMKPYLIEKGYSVDVLDDYVKISW